MKLRACAVVASCWLLCFFVGCHKPAKVIMLLQNNAGTLEPYVENGSTIEIHGDLDEPDFKVSLHDPAGLVIDCDLMKTDKDTQQKSVVCRIPTKKYAKPAAPPDKYTIIVTPVDERGNPPAGTTPPPPKQFYVRPCPPICMPNNSK